MERNKKLSKKHRERFIKEAEKVLKDPKTKWITLDQFLEEVEKREKAE